MKREQTTIEDIRESLAKSNLLNQVVEIDCYSDSIITYTHKENEFFLEVNVIADATFVKRMTVQELISQNPIGYFHYGIYLSDELTESMQYTTNQ